MLSFFNPHLRIYLLMRKREKYQCERETLTSCLPCVPDWGSNLQLRYVPQPGIKPAAFWCKGQCFNQLSHLARVRYYVCCTQD